MNLAELEAVVTAGNMPKFVAKQLAKWIYEKRVSSFEEMTGISKKNCEWLNEYYTVGYSRPTKASRSSDGTIKYLFRSESGFPVESVYIPDKERATLCISSQAGCKMNCYFCATGRLGFKSQLTAHDIINQVLAIPNSQTLTNIVFMGMGEPLDNLTQVLRVIEILTAPWGLSWSPKRITVSSVGKLPQLKELLDKTQVHIAISVHTADPEQRQSMMPAQKAFPIKEVMHVLSGYDFSHQRRLSLEYIMWRGLNDDVAHADMLIKLIGKIDCRVNLIRFHSIEGVDLHPCSEERMIMFRNYLNKHGITATIRASRGEDIEAACGQLAAKK